MNKTLGPGEGRGGGKSHKKERGCSSTFWGQKTVLEPSLFRSIAGTSAVRFRVLSRKEDNTRKCVVLRLGFKPRPQNRILVPLRGSFQNFWRQPCPIHMGGPGKRTEQTLTATNLKHHILIENGFEFWFWNPSRETPWLKYQILSGNKL